MVLFWKVEFWAASVMAYAVFPLLKGVVATAIVVVTAARRLG